MKMLNFPERDLVMATKSLNMTGSDQEVWCSAKDPGGSLPDLNSKS